MEILKYAAVFLALFILGAILVRLILIAGDILHEHDR
jgi:hypothetical protein